ncbi:MAG: hypothetical protein MJZ02_08265, partial [Paludibacteraceae bacterium]|nr:hypothetical protein [Paludibacteraceae bacterium]
DNSYSLYPLNGAEVTFDEQIARMGENVSNWGKVKSTETGCVLDTTEVSELKLFHADENRIKKALLNAQYDYNICVMRANELITFNESEIEVHHAANKYATELFNEITKEEDYINKNVIFSPTSLQFALAMLANGADNDTVYAELTKAIGRENMPLDQLNEMYNKRLNKLKTVDHNRVKLNMANATFLANDRFFGKNFMQNLENYYYAATNNVDFSNDSTYKKMDQWALENTDSMIPTIGVQPNPNLVCVLANALSFQSEWQDKFNKDLTVKEKFVTGKGDEILVDKMKNAVSMYAEGEYFQLVTLPFYENFVMNVILPKGRATLDIALSEVNFENISYKWGIDTVYIANLSLPKFKTDNNINFEKSLNKMGLSSIYQNYFNNIAEGVSVSKISQMDHLEIDEDGAKGAAVTTVATVGSGLIHYEFIDFDVNQPFVVTINNPYTQEILFIGLINDPNEKGGF